MIDFENYKVFVWTDKQLQKQYSQSILNKYYKILAYLFQNGYVINYENEEGIEEQLAIYNYFKSKEDFLELCSITKSKSSFDIGKKIFLEELYDIIKNSTFTKQEADNPVIIKTYASTYWEKIKTLLKRLEDLYFSEDFEIVGVTKQIPSLEKLRSKILKLKEVMQRDVKVLTWILFAEIINSSYSIYISNNRAKTDVHKFSIASNFNDELYGGIGGYNPSTGEIKCIIGSAVYDVKSCYSSTTNTKTKSLAKIIFKEDPKETDDLEIKFLKDWLDGKEKDDERAKRVVINSCLFGIISLLSLKHNINFLKDKRNGERAEKVIKEFEDILKFCGIERSYLL